MKVTKVQKYTNDMIVFFRFCDVKADCEHVGQIDPWCLCHQHAYTKLLHMQMLLCPTSISTTILCPILQVHSTRSWAPTSLM